MRKLAIIAVIAVAILGLLAVSVKRSKPHIVPTTAEIQQKEGIPIQLAPAAMGDISDTLQVTGDIKALRTATLSPKIMAKVISVSGREGDAVSQGMTVVQLDQEDALAGVQQAQAGLQSALARLSQARTGARVQVTQSSAGIQQAQAALTAARANLQLVKKGARSQERLIAQAGVNTAKANLDNAEANLRRNKILFNQGATSAAQLDVAQTQYNVAKAQYDSAAQNLSLVKAGARSEQIQQAETQVTQAEEALRVAKANAAQNDLKKEDITSAQAGVAQAKAALNIAQQQLANTYVKSPITGYISKRMTEPGQQASPGTSLVEVVDVSTVYFEAEVSETSLARVKPGQTVRVEVDAFGDRPFLGKIQKIFPSGTAGRKFMARVAIPNPGGDLRPGMFARGSIILATHNNVLIVPQDAIDQRDGQTLVFTAKDGVATAHEVIRGLTNDGYVEIRGSDIVPGDQVVVSGHEDLKNGTKVYVAD